MYVQSCVTITRNSQNYSQIDELLIIEEIGSDMWVPLCFNHDNIPLQRVFSPTLGLFRPVLRLLWRNKGVGSRNYTKIAQDTPMTKIFAP